MNETVAALLGVALGGAFSLIGQWVGSSRSHRFARGETDRQARISAVADFSRALVEYRMAALTRGMTTFQLGAASEDQLETHRRARATAWHAYYRIQMLLPESPVQWALERWWRRSVTSSMQPMRKRRISKPTPSGNDSPLWSQMLRAS